MSGFNFADNNVIRHIKALLTLNSCPMFTYNGRDSHRNITPSRINLPYKPFIADILPERRKTEDDEADAALQRLPAPGLKGTWARAYALLTKLVSKIGWDELLKTRSAVFVMEEEYRMQKAQTEVRAVQESDSKPAIHEDGMVAPVPKHKDGDADDDASTRGVVSPSSEKADRENEDDPDNLDDVSSKQAEAKSDLNVSAIPTIRISTESERDRELNGDSDKGQTNGRSQADDSSGLEKPVQAASGEKSDE